MNRASTRIAFVSPWRVDDPPAWSGVIMPMFTALCRHATVIPIFTGDVRPALPDRAMMRLLDGFHGQHYLADHAWFTAAKRAHGLERRLREAGIDVILDVAASTDLALMRPSCPVVHVADATVEAVEDYYPQFSRLLWISRIQARRIGRRATRASDRYAAASEWAATSLRDDYGIAPSSVSVIPFGPAIEPDFHFHRRSRVAGPLRALLVASDWERKGGSTALAAIEAARSAGIDVTLTIVGQAPAKLPVWARSVGKADRRHMEEHYQTHDVLLEPTRASAVGVTLTDAAAFGLPCIAADTGGVSTIVQDGRTGFLLPPNDFVNRVPQTLAALSDTDFWALMSDTARARHETCLSWEAWAQQTARLAGDTIRGQHLTTIAADADAALPTATVDATVIIPTHNRSELLRRQLSALARQLSSAAFDVVVVDNRSTEDLAPVIGEYSRAGLAVRLVNAPDKASANYARNVGAAHSTAPVLLFCDSDDVVADDWLEAMLTRLRMGDSIVGGRMDLDLLNDPGLALRGGNPPSDDLPVAFGEIRYPIGANMAVRGEVFRTVGGFDEDFVGGHDEVILAWNAQRCGFPTSFASEAVVHYTLRSQLRDTLKQRYLYGKTYAQLYSRLRHSTILPNRTLAQEFGWWRRHLARSLQSVRDPHARDEWLVATAWAWGRVMGSLRYGLLCPL